MVYEGILNSPFSILSRRSHRSSSVRSEPTPPRVPATQRPWTASPTAPARGVAEATAAACRGRPPSPARDISRRTSTPRGRLARGRLTANDVNPRKKPTSEANQSASGGKARRSAASSPPGRGGGKARDVPRRVTGRRAAPRVSRRRRRVFGMAFN